MTVSPSMLRALAQRIGIHDSYIDVGGLRHDTTDETRVALLHALGLDTRTQQACLAALETIPAPSSQGLPAALRCFTVEEALRGSRCFGLVVNLWAVRSRRNWGVGDLTDLGDLAAWAGAHGADFLGFSPLHASRNCGGEVSPYSPLSRFFRNPLYLDVEVIPEFSETPEAQFLMDAADFRIDLAEVRGAEALDHARVMSLKRPVLELLHRTFAARHAGRPGERGAAYDRFRARSGELLLDFATFCVLDEHESRAGRFSWHDWIARLRDPRSSAVRKFREKHADEVDFHCFVQFELDRQLGLAAERARLGGMRLGLYPDLAVGSLGEGADPWMFPGLFVEGASVGCPPDPLGPEGQDWGFPPMDPRRLAEEGFLAWDALLEASLAHAGALRIDHVLGMQRLFWIPRGMAASQGAYVTQPMAELLRVLAQRSRRAKAILVGEDLGTVPEGFEDVLARAGLLSMRVLLFERSADGGFVPSSRLSPRALVCASTHDLPPLLGWRAGRDIAIRAELGLMPRAESARRLEERARDVASLVERLRAEGAVSGEGEPDATAFVAGVHAYLAKSRAPLVALQLDDVLGETEPVNLPGVRQEMWPSWTRRHRVLLEDLPNHGHALASLGAARSRARAS